MNSTKSKSLPWDIVEKAILKEKQWLKDNLEPVPFANQKNHCEDCILRRIAILIVSGHVKTKDIKSKISLWGTKKNLKIIKRHGREWHTEMMSLVANHFKSQGYEITIEPTLTRGRADLGVYKKNKKHLFVEIGSVSPLKLLINLESMEESMFLIVLSKKHAIEFTIEKADKKCMFI